MAAKPSIGATIVAPNPTFAPARQAFAAMSADELADLDAKWSRARARLAVGGAPATEIARLLQLCYEASGGSETRFLRCAEILSARPCRIDDEAEIAQIVSAVAAGADERRELRRASRRTLEIEFAGAAPSRTVRERRLEAIRHRLARKLARKKLGQESDVVRKPRSMLRA